MNSGSPTRRLVILGSGTFATETLDIAESAGGFCPAGFVNSIERPAAGACHAGLPVFWVDDLPYGPDDCVLVAGIVSTARRGLIESLTARGYRFVTVAHPSSVISRRARIGAGCVINAAAVVSQNAVLNEHVILNRGCLIGHDNHLGRFTTVGPGANIAGGNIVGEGTFIAAGAVIRDHLTIGEGAVIGAGAVVVKPIPAHALAVGVPARIIRTGVEGL